jgi:hypothetical protein
MRPIRYDRLMLRSRRAMALVVVALVVLASALTSLGCVAGRGKPRPEPSHVDASDDLAAIGARAESDDVDALADAYVARGRSALRVAAGLLLTGADPLHERGARWVLMSLKRGADFEFLNDLPPAPPHDERRACGMIEVMFLVRQTVDTNLVEEEDRSFPIRRGARFMFVAPFARLLSRVADQRWPTCVKTCPTCETSRLNPRDVACETLHEMDPLARGRACGGRSSVAP